LRGWLGSQIWACVSVDLRFFEDLRAWASKGYIPGGPVGDFQKLFPGGGAKAVKFVFYPSKLKKQTFFANNFKIQGGLSPPAPFRRPCMRVGCLWACFNKSLLCVFCKFLFCGLLFLQNLWHFFCFYSLHNKIWACFLCA